MSTERSSARFAERMIEVYDARKLLCGYVEQVISQPQTVRCISQAVANGQPSCIRRLQINRPRRG